MAVAAAGKRTCGIENVLAFVHVFTKLAFLGGVAQVRHKKNCIPTHPSLSLSHLHRHTHAHTHTIEKRKEIPDSNVQIRKQY